jgi:hypothetical protein
MHCSCGLTAAHGHSCPGRPGLAWLAHGTGARPGRAWSSTERVRRARGARWLAGGLNHKLAMQKWTREHGRRVATPEAARE